jgi:O-acetylserine/cysteine efflux transporter
VIVASAIWGSNFVVTKEALHDTSPLVLGMWRAALGGTVLVGVGLAIGGSLPMVRGHLREIFWLALHMTTLSTAFLILGVKRVPAGLGSLLSNTMPLFMVLLALPMIGERPTRRALFGMAIGFAGTALIAAPALHGETSALGIVFMLLAALTWASGSILYKKYDLGLVHPFLIVGVQLWLSAIGLAIAGIPIEGVHTTHLSVAFLASLAYLAIVGLALVFVVWGEILQRGSATEASATAYLVPLFGVLFGALFLGEDLTLVELLGGLLVLAGVGVITRNRRTALAPVTPE